ncbi:helix-turn-helix domain-containing protein [Aequorivita capsosiphonis]|uniref:helix-turn-helix domain-containing protein n=1 Tax=Aequorivita capsosiphonis TaxID=487317 RepID=UPI000413529E|nr:helix-turn-helix transcriptional regulator [Aequorivita capsosiphonis]
MELNFYSSLVIAGIIQGVFLTVYILLLAKYRTRASIYLGLLILFITLSILQELLWETGAVTSLEYYHLFLPYSFAQAALFYFFVMIFLYPDRKNIRLEKLFYLPFLVILFASLIFKLVYLVLDISHPFFISMYAVMEFIDTYGDFLSILMVSLVLLILWKQIEIYHKKPVKYYSEIVKSKLTWLKILFILLFLFNIFWMYATIVGALINENEYPAYLLLIGISIIIYTLGYIGTRKIGVQEERRKIRKSFYGKQDYSISEETKGKHILLFEKRLIEEKKFLDSSITLDSMADDLQISSSHLSRMINAELKTTFSNYINLLRVKEAKIYLLQPEFSEYTLLAIGLEAGFNSKTTFNTTFKKITGQTPSQFKKTASN